MIADNLGIPCAAEAVRLCAVGALVLGPIAFAAKGRAAYAAPVVGYSSLSSVFSFASERGWTRVKIAAITSVV